MTYFAFLAYLLLSIFLSLSIGSGNGEILRYYFENFSDKCGVKDYGCWGDSEREVDEPFFNQSGDPKLEF